MSSKTPPAHRCRSKKMSEVFRSIRDFLFSIMNKQFFVFLFFLLLSAVIWLIMTLNETYEKELEVPVRITNIPKNVVLTSASIDTIHVTVRDKDGCCCPTSTESAEPR